MNKLQFKTRHLSPDVQELVDTIINGVVALASRVNSNSDSNSLGGILIDSQVELQAMPEMKPHDLRHAFATRLLERGVNIRIIQELMGHSNVNTTQDYTAVVGSHLEGAIKALNQPPQTTVSDDQIQKLMKLVAKIAEMNGKSPYDPTNGISPVTYG